jgi:large subunit ribosomal protein L4
MQFEVHDRNGQGTGRFVELPDAVFGVEPNDHAIYLTVKQYLANQRQGTHKAKEKSEVSGSTRKLKRQKGTGGARAGSIKSPVFVGGARVFGPRPRNYDMKINKKVRVLARNSAFSHKAKAGSIIIVEDFSYDAPKTQNYVAFLKGLGIAGKKSLLVLGEPNENLLRSARNIPKVSISRVSDLNTYSILNGGTLLITESAAQHFNA